MARILAPPRGSTAGLRYQGAGGGGGSGGVAGGGGGGGVEVGVGVPVGVAVPVTVRVVVAVGVAVASRPPPPSKAPLAHNAPTMMTTNSRPPANTATSGPRAPPPAEQAPRP